MPSPLQHLAQRHQVDSVRIAVEHQVKSTFPFGDLPEPDPVDRYRRLHAQHLVALTHACICSGEGFGILEYFEFGRGCAGGARLGIEPGLIVQAFKRVRRRSAKDAHPLIQKPLCMAADQRGFLAGDEDIDTLLFAKSQTPANVSFAGQPTGLCRRIIGGQQSQGLRVRV